MFTVIVAALSVCTAIGIVGAIIWVLFVRESTNVEDEGHQDYSSLPTPRGIEDNSTSEEERK